MLNEEEELVGREIGLILSKGNGKRTISGAFFSPPSSTTVSISSDSSAASASIRYSGLNSVNREWPEDIHSVSGLQSVGFNRKLLKWPLSDITVVQIPILCHLSYETLFLVTWVWSILRNFVISHQLRPWLEFESELQFRMLFSTQKMPNFFGTASLYQWLEQTLGTNYNAPLLHVERVKEICAMNVANKKGERRNIDKLVFLSKTEAADSSSSIPMALASEVDLVKDYVY
jgi:hypothetical protein